MLTRIYIAIANMREIFIILPLYFRASRNQITNCAFKLETATDSGQVASTMQSSDNKEAYTLASNFAATIAPGKSDFTHHRTAIVPLRTY